MNETLQQIVAEIRKAAQVERDRSWVGAPHGADEWKLDDWADRIERALAVQGEVERGADKNRLDWLEENRAEVVIDFYNETRPKWVCQMPRHWPLAQRGTSYVLRDAIDAARTQEKPR